MRFERSLQKEMPQLLGVGAVDRGARHASALQERLALASPVPRVQVDAIEPRARRAARSVVRRAGTWAITALLATVGIPPPAAAVETDNILVLYSNGRLFPSNVEGDRGLHQTIRSSANRPVVLFYEFLDAPRFGGLSFEEVFATYLREKYASRPPRVIIAVSQEALDFLLRNRTELFPQVPMVHVGVDTVFLQSLPPLPGDLVGVPADYGFSRTMELALRWHPRARRLLIVTGASGRDRGLEARARKESSAFSGRVSLEFLTGMPTRDVLKRLGELGSDTVVFTPGTLVDGDGREFTGVQSVEAMAAASSAPVYGPFSTFIGTGVVGGYMPSFEAMGREAGYIINELLAGAEPGSLRLPEITAQTLNVDWRQVRRWGIDENDIPNGAVVHFKPPTLLEAYHDQVIVASSVFLLQAALIGLLIVERRRRRTAEQTEEKQRHELAHASRLAIAGELTGSIAHEINQPLGAILSNADAAELILESGEDRCDELRGILADIRRDDLRASEVIRRLRSLLAKHEAERQPFDLNEAAREIEPVLRSELRRRRVNLEIRTAAAPVITVGDRIETQQVLINLVLNAMDAVADVPEQQRAVVVSVEGGADVAAVEVRDAGHGISPEYLPKLFDPFFTTKNGGMGLGLSIVRTMVEAHGGRVWAENASGGGAVFRVELPVAGTIEVRHRSRHERDTSGPRRR